MTIPITQEVIDGMTSDSVGYIYPKGYIVQQYPKIRVPQEVTETAVRNAYKQFTAREPRFELLHNYYIGKHRFPAETSTGNTVVSNLCGYIAKALRGYIIGNRPQYISDEGDSYGEKISDLYNEQNKWLTDAELINDMIVYGRAFELVYRDSKDPKKPKSVRCSPRDAFVAYAGDMEQDSVFGCVRYVEVDENQVKHYRLYLYTVDEAQVWVSDSADGPWTMESSAPHGMGRVPLIEYANNMDYMGDFEPVIGLQDAYNQLLSDRLDDKTAFAQAMLKITGSVIGQTTDEIAESLGKLRKGKVLQLDTDASADFLVKTMDETGIQVYQDQLKNDIHKEAMVPDLSDEQFANNASGVSMAYKLFGTDQMVADKVAQYEKGYARRCKLYDAVLFNATASPEYEPKADIGGMSIKFRFNSPQDLSYATTAFSTAISAGFLSKQTAIENLSIVDDAQTELDRIKGEQEEQDARQEALFGQDYTEAGMESEIPGKPVKPSEEEEEEEEE